MSAQESKEENGAQSTSAGMEEGTGCRDSGSFADSAGRALGKSRSSFKPLLSADQQETTDSRPQQRRHRKSSKGQASTSEQGLSSASVYGAASPPWTSTTGSGMATNEDTAFSSKLSSAVLSLLAKRDSTAAEKAAVQELYAAAPDPGLLTPGVEWTTAPHMKTPEEKKVEGVQATSVGATEDSGRRNSATVADSAGSAPAEARSSSKPRVPTDQRATTDSHAKQRRRRKSSKRQSSTVAELAPSSASVQSVASAPSVSSTGSVVVTVQNVASPSKLSSVEPSLMAKQDSFAAENVAVQEVAKEVVKATQAAVSTPVGKAATEERKADTVGTKSPRHSLASKTSSLRSTLESIKALSALLQETRGQAASAPEVTPRTAASRQRQRRSLQFKVLATALVSIGLVAVTLLLFRRAYRVTRAHCATKSCVDHRSLIEAQLDASVNPCDDFSAHVCGRWRPRREFLELSRSALMDLVMLWQKKLRQTLYRSLHLLPVGRKAAAMFNSCITQTGSQVGIVKDFMRAHGLVWPEDPSDDLGPLEVLIDLAFNWNVDLWFSLKLLPSSLDGYAKRRIFVDMNDLILQWRAVFRQIPRAHFAKVYTNIFSLFNTDENTVPAHVRIAADFNRLNYVFDVLSSLASKARTPAVLSLHDLSKQSDATTATYIKHSFATRMRVQPPVTLDDLMLFSDINLLKSIIHIFSNVDDHAVRLHLAWLFLHAYAAVANPEAVLLVLHGSKHRAEMQRPIFCASQVEASYRLLVSAMATVAYFPQEERQRIDSHLAGVLKMAVEKTMTAAWIDNTTTNTAIEKLMDVRTVLWPAEKFLTARGLEEYYSSFTEDAASFADFWVETRRSLRRLAHSPLGVEELRIHDGIAEPYFEYLHVLNEVSLSLGALAPPLYYSDGTKAMLYGGLGYFYAMELVGALDSEGVKVDPSGNIVSSWLSKAVKPVFEERVLGCLPRSNASIFPEVPALEVAFAAFQRELNGNDMQLSDALTEEKVFFITACLPSCAKTAADNLYGGNCNKAMANFAPFARTFRCPLGSNMNPEKKCTFFG